MQNIDPGQLQQQVIQRAGYLAHAAAIAQAPAGFDQHGAFYIALARAVSAKEMIIVHRFAGIQNDAVHICAVDADVDFLAMHAYVVRANHIVCGKGSDGGQVGTRKSVGANGKQLRE